MPSVSICSILLGSDCAYRALSSAGTTIDAGVRIDNELTISHADCANRALSLTSSTSYACTTDFICHNRILL